MKSTRVILKEAADLDRPSTQQREDDLLAQFWINSKEVKQVLLDNVCNRPGDDYCISQQHAIDLYDKLMGKLGFEKDSRGFY